MDSNPCVLIKHLGIFFRIDFMLLLFSFFDVALSESMEYGILNRRFVSSYYEKQKIRAAGLLYKQPNLSEIPLFQRFFAPLFLDS